MKKQGATFQKIIVPAVIVAIVVYLIFSAWNGLRDPYSFVIVYTDTMEESIDTEGWVVRSEEPVKGGGGLVQLKRNEGEKVAEGAAIAMVYEDEEYVDNQEELLRTKSDLTALQYATYDGSPAGAALEDQMMAALSELRAAASSGDYSNLSEETETYRKLVLRREYLLSSDATAAMTQAAAQLQSRYDELQAHQSKASSIQAPVSGLFSSYVDGYETVLTPAKLEGLGPRDLEAFAQTDPTPADNVIGKLVTNAAWYYAITVPGDTVGRFDNGDSVDVFFDSLSESFPMTVYSVGEVQDNKLVVVLRSSQDDDKAEDLRQESGRVIFHSSEGIRVPKQALRITKDGERGVYVVVSQKARFRPVTILAEDDTSYLVKAAPTSEEDTRILRDGDQVVLASAELTDGKVVR